MFEINDSSHITGADWNEGVLVVRFKDGREYEYYDVPVGVFQELISSPSKGTFLKDNIKGAFEYSRRT